MTGEQSYEAPALSEIGTLHELTLQGFDKVGSKEDIYGPILDGSIIPDP